MKKALNIFALFVAVILLCGVTASCSKEENNEKPIPTVQKTVIVFYPYADNLTYNDYLQKDINEMMSAIQTSGAMSNYRMMVYYGSQSYSALLYEMKLENGQIVKDTIQQYSSVRQNDEQYLTDVFNKIKSVSPANTYTMIVGGHGNGWLPSSVNWVNVNSSKAASQRKSFGAYSLEKDRIDPATFASAMTGASLHTDLMIFDCCHMACIETAYDLRNNTDYFLSSAGEQLGDGFYYTSIWKDIIGTMNKSVLQDICTQTTDYYDTNNIGYYEESHPYDNVNPLSLGAIDCSELDNLAATMASINLKYPETVSDLTDSIQRFDQKSVGVYFDLLDYVKYRVGGDETNTDYLNAKNDISNAVITTACHGYYLVILGSALPNSFPVTTFCGITTSDPSVNTSVIELKKTTNWWKATH